MFKLVTGASIGVLAGILISCGVLFWVPSNSSSWRIVKVSQAAGKDDVECFPKQSIVGAAETSFVREHLGDLRTDLPADAIAIARSLLRDERAPLPYDGQRAIRSTGILISLMRRLACSKSHDAECQSSHGYSRQAANIVEQSHEHIERTIGRWSILAQIDLKNSSFCMRQ